MKGSSAVVIGVDTGGTFTDVFASNGHIVKVPSSPDAPEDAILAALKQIGAGKGDAVAHGTTVATNAVLERTGARTVLLTTKHFEDVLEIRRQNRPALYDLKARWPKPLVPPELRIGVEERLDFNGQVLIPLRADSLSQALEALPSDVESVAICLLYSYLASEHERRLAATLATALGSEVPVSLSSRIAPRQREYERASTTVINAYVAPRLRGYLEALKRGLRSTGIERLDVMQSNGGLIDVGGAAAAPVNTILSGPAAGVTGAVALSGMAERTEIITFDMGGTSTDVAVVPGRTLERTEGQIDGFPVLVPMLAIETVGAGGGSIARVDAGGGLHVGPASAGAVPGPASYGRGEEATVTDANLLLGRLPSSGLLGGDVPLDIGRARRALKRVALPLQMTVERASHAVVAATISNMNRAVRAATLQQGFDPRRFALVAFGGAGPLHACELAKSLGIGTVLIPPFPGVLSAAGLTVPPSRRDAHRTVLIELNRRAPSLLEGLFQKLEAEAIDGIEQHEIFGPPKFERFAEARYVGQSFELSVPYSGAEGSLRASFENSYRARYGRTPENAAVEIAHLRVRATLPRLKPPNLTPPWPEEGPKAGVRPVGFEANGRADALVFLESIVLWRPSLALGFSISGPAVIEQYDSTILVPPGWTASVEESFNLVLEHV